MKNKYLIPIFVVLLFTSVFVITSLTNNFNNGVSSDNPIEYHSNVCVYKNGELVDCSHNLLYDSGKDLIRTYLGDTGGSGDEIDQIELCNSTAGCGAPQADASESYTAYTSCGLEQATGTYGSLNTGNWSIFHTFTSTCDNIETNMTRLKNTAGTNFAGVRFTDVTLQSSDKLTINWTIWVD